MKKSPQWVGLVAVMLAMTGTSIAPTLVKFGLKSHEAPVPLLAMRQIIAAMVLWVMLYITNRPLMRLHRQGIARCFAVAVCNSISLTAFYLSLVYIDASVAIIVFSLNPMFVLLILTVRGEPLTRLAMARLVLALCGIILLVGISGNVRWEGIALTMITASFYGLYLVLIQELLGGYPSQQVVTYVITFMALIIGTLFVIFYQAEVSFSTTGWAVIVVTAVFSTAIARFALFVGIRHLGSGQAALLGPLEALMTVTWSVMFLGEKIGLVQLGGAALILLSAALASRRVPMQIPASRPSLVLRK